MEVIFDIETMFAQLIYQGNTYQYNLNYNSNLYWKHYTFIHNAENIENISISWKFEFYICNNKEQFITFYETKYFSQSDVDGVTDNKLIKFSYIAKPSLGTIQNDTIYMNTIDSLRLRKNNIFTIKFSVVNSPIKDWQADQNCKLGYYY